MFLILLLFVACKATMVQQSMFGEFHKEDKDYKYNLTISQDSTFLLSMKYQDANPQCSGRWKYIGNDTLLLVCNEVEDISEMLTNAYLSDREKKVIILSPKKIKFENVILKKKD